MRFFEDIEIGEKTRLGTYTFTEAEIVAFARAWDPQPFHLDAAAGARTHFGGLVASGWQTAAISSKLRAEACLRLHEALQREGRKVPRIGPSPGFKDLHWLLPIRAGDTLTFESEVTAKNASATRPEWGLVFTHETGTDQLGRLAFEFTNCVFVERLEA
ncbi:MaoC domain protein dehydratase [Ancylobacter novellus DSM 506]|uniref:MaoC domain protein dehydratase n=1 Tax=Ancylobacter novellus (strain ATCC 8093 / DSM 506 / JCM 20403 / CCM 1077 / IAM 12100 / NBRC 12443 / NCIMB 10456) TaxID=639283 RepID=D7A3L2_ANCN5|nr:MaoC/PaaZ C-terminal domain-containing protein [Ancylobacter novellus]ADH89771.1 MaoC domain protein dehydratase [Ancylobacter novellus DSM 506]